MFLRKKANAVAIFSVVASVLALVILGIVMGISQTINTQIRDSNTDTDGYAYNASAQSLESVDKIASWQPTMGTVVGAVAILVIIIGAFAFLGFRKMMG